MISSRAQLLRSSGGTWPREGCTLEEDVADLERHEREHREHMAFTYAIMNPAETECLGCLYMNPLECLLGHDAGSGEFLSDRTAYVSFWARSTRLADHLDTRLLTAMIPWFLNEWVFSHVHITRPKERRTPDPAVRGDGLRLLYSLKPHQPFLDIVLAYLVEPPRVRTPLKE